jgi:NADP-dependent 3-hydroxy acid dehydrogenase YdfG
LHAHSWQVGLLDRNAEGLASLAAELGEAWQGAVDVTDVDAVQQALTAFCAPHHGQLRLLCNCAGILHCGSFEAIETTEHARIVQVNVLGLMQVTHAAFPYLKNTPQAQVINMAQANKDSAGEF